MFTFVNSGMAPGAQKAAEQPPVPAALKAKLPENVVGPAPLMPVIVTLKSYVCACAAIGNAARTSIDAIIHFDTVIIP
jgi:hypothetical protein